MISFLLGIVLLIVGYITYGKIVERVINPDDRSTPAYELQDGVDYIPMSSPRAFLIQLLNTRSHIRCYFRCNLGTGGLPVDRLRNNICRWCS